MQNVNQAASVKDITELMTEVVWGEIGYSDAAVYLSITCKYLNCLFFIQGYIFWPGGGEFLSELKTGKNLKEDFMQKGREKGRKEEKRKNW